MKALVIFTDSFPYGNGETFLESEIKHINNFDKVFFFPIHSNPASGDIRETYGIETVNAEYFQDKKIVNPIKLRTIVEALNVFPNKNFIKCVYSLINFESDIKKISATEKLVDLLSSYDEIVLYSYWLYIEALFALDLKKILTKKGKKVTVISRAHGFDIYKERNPLSYSTYQRYLVKNLDKIYPCSNKGRDYLRAANKKYSEKIETAYLGVNGDENIKFPKKGEVFNIVSCSNITEVKRVYLIARSLSLITDKKIIWTHFGDGDQKEAILEECKTTLPSNIEFDFKGRVSNKELVKHYRDNNYNLFINVSSSEGIPVSIMEAFSFGIPTVATNVGGTGELVKSGKNGFLLEKDFEISKLSSLILKFIDMNEEEYLSFCRSAREVYEKDFCAEKNYKEFYKEISK